MATNYRKLKKLGSGGFGEVWMTERNIDKKHFAVKYLIDESDKDGVERFKREVRCLSQLDHPNILRVISRRLLRPPYWYAMHPYSGSLFDELPGIVGNHERINVVFRSILDGLRYAHGEGVIHRDLKPENILMNSDTDLVVSDFGLGRILDSKSTRKTHTGMRLGTYLYCAPEQMRDAKSADERSDIFSLGRMLYELYAGELTSAVQNLADVPASIAPIVERATFTNPDKRYQAVEKMIEDFDGAMGVLLGIVEADSLDDLIEKLRASDSWNRKEVTQITAALDEIKEEDELVHAALMKIPARLFAKIASSSGALARSMIKSFARYAESQGWPFSYTDSIADVASSLFDELDDSAMRANLFEAVLLVGAAHNRWHVMAAAGAMVDKARGTDDVAEIMKVLKAHASEREYIQGYITRSKLHPSLRRFFPKPATG